MLLQVISGPSTQLQQGLTQDIALLLRKKYLKT